MRKSTVFALAFLLIGMGLLLFVGRSWLDSYAPVIELTQQLTRQFEARGDLAPGTRVEAVQLKAEPGLEGPGLRLRIVPAASVQAEPGGLRRLVRAAAASAGESYTRGGPGGVRWLRVRVVLGPPDAGPESGLTRDVVLRRGYDGGVGEPEPPLPDRWPEAPPAAPSPDPGAPR